MTPKERADTVLASLLVILIFLVLSGAAMNDRMERNLRSVEGDLIMSRAIYDLHSCALDFKELHKNLLALIRGIHNDTH